ncbi:hypothetical protein HYV85_05790 [Candidatus Woesearchaeota archaeon]|nr:hypothetical protein [Candidatus Woesearchaeota archaeon]
MAKRATIVVGAGAEVHSQACGFKAEMIGFLDYVRNSKGYKSKYYDFGEDGVEVSELVS